MKNIEAMRLCLADGPSVIPRPWTSGVPSRPCFLCYFREQVDIFVILAEESCLRTLLLVIIFMFCTLNSIYENNYGIVKKIMASQNVISDVSLLCISDVIESYMVGKKHSHACLLTLLHTMYFTVNETRRCYVILSVVNLYISLICITTEGSTCCFHLRNECDIREWQDRMCASPRACTSEISMSDLQNK